MICQPQNAEISRAECLRHAVGHSSRAVLQIQFDTKKKNSCTFQLHPALDVTTAVKFMRRFLFSRIFGPSHQQLN